MNRYKNIHNKEKQMNKRNYYFYTELNQNEKIKEKLEEKRKEETFSQINDQLEGANKEKVILSRIKYCIKVILKNLSPISKTNFTLEEKSSSENLAKALNKMLELEGSDGNEEILKEKTFPLKWFGLYLESNIDNIPPEYKLNNYEKLYNELISESNETANKIKNDDTLNIVYSKIINIEKMIDNSKNILTKIKSNQKNFEILDFILNTEIPATMYIYVDDMNEINHIEFTKKNEKSKYNPKIKEKFKRECKNISEFSQNFPNLTNEIDALELEEKIGLKNSLKDYFKIIEEYINEAFPEENEKNKIIILIEDFIHSQLYDKLYSGMATLNDIAILKKCFT